VKSDSNSFSAPPDIATDTTMARATRPEDKVGFWEKTALGAGGLPLFLGYAAIGSFAIPFYQMTLKLDPVWLVAALTVPRMLDAFLDPIIGRFSDNFRTRFGRRRPLVALGALIQGIAFGLIWMVPPDWGHVGLTAWLVVSQLIFYAGFSLFSVPLAALQYEITPDYDERTRVAAVGGFFGKIGEVGYNYVFPLASTALFVSAISGVRTLGWIVGLCFLGLIGLLPAIFVRERFSHKVEKQAAVRLWPGVQAAFSNRAFSILVALTLLQIGAGMFASNLDRYLLVYFIKGGDIAAGEVWKGHLSVAFAVVGILSIYPVNWVAQRIGKTKTLMAAFAMTLMGAAGKWILYTPGYEWKILFDALLCGPVWIAINVLTPAMLADICDEDEHRHGFRREGVFGAIFLWVQKMGYSAAFFGALLSLKLTGFDAALGGAQSPDTILRLRVILTGSTALWAVLAIVLLCFYPLNRQRAYQIRDALEARRGKV
jgi:GPH family glycoside/pentoside/hexuronide:cation symporter